jgi:photosystem II stability/assembly factor-like uncharacterized protein
MKRVHIFLAIAVLAVAALSQVQKPAVPGRTAAPSVGPQGFCDRFAAKAFEAAHSGPINRALPPPIDGANPPWECVGPDGGYIVAADYDRADPRRIYVALYAGGIYRTLDGGDSWMKVGANTSNNNGIAVDPTNGQKVYALSYYGVRRSLDGGSNWQSFSFPTYCYGTSGPVVDPVAPNTLYVGGYHYYDTTYWYYSLTVLKSTNGGQTWTNVDMNPTVTYGYSLSIAISHSSPNILLLGGYEYTDSFASKIYKSTNAGANWTDVTGAVNSDPYALAVDPLDCNRVFAGTYGYVFRSLDGGASWAPSNTYLSAPELAIDPSNPNVLYAGGYGCYKSVDGGVNWVSSGAGLSGTGQDLVASGSAVFMVGTAGFFRSDDGALTWQSRNSNLRGSVIPAVAVAPSQPQTVYIEAQNYSILKTLNAGGSWQATMTPDQCGLPAKLIVHPTDSNHVYFLSGG